MNNSDNNNTIAALIYACIGLWVLGLMLGLALIIWSFMNIHKASDTLTTTVLTMVEDAYYEGQIDVLSGDIRVKQAPSGKWYPIKSAWDKDSIITPNNVIEHE